MNKESFYKFLENNNIILSEYQKNQFKIYCEFLIEYNKSVNLTAIKDEEGIYLKHFLDSASLAFNYRFTNESILDIGTGAGFPGIVLKILFPDIKLTLIDSNNKKTKFLNLVLEKLNIKDVLVITDRIENINNKESFDIIVSRAVSELRILCELSIPYLKKDGKLIALKSHANEEILSSLETIEILGGNKPNIIDVSLNDQIGKRCFIEIKKIKSTDKMYPRSYDKILKKPLKKTSK